MTWDPQTMVMIAVIAFLALFPNALGGLAGKLAGVIRPPGGVVPAAGNPPAAGGLEVLQTLEKLFSQHLAQTHVERTGGGLLSPAQRSALSSLIQEELKSHLAKLLNPPPATPPPAPPPSPPPAV